MAAVLLVAWVVLSAVNTARHGLCHTVFPSLYFRDFQFQVPLSPVHHLLEGMDYMPTLNTSGSRHPPSAPRSPPWSRRCVHLAPSCTVCLPPGSFMPVPRQLPSALLSSLGSTQLYLIDRQRDMTHSCVQTLLHLADDLSPINLNAS